LGLVPEFVFIDSGGVASMGRKHDKARELRPVELDELGPRVRLVEELRADPATVRFGWVCAVCGRGRPHHGRGDNALTWRACKCGARRGAVEWGRLAA
jgi:hypothetical protein